MEDQTNEDDILSLGGKNVWISDFGRKISLNFGEDLFFFLETTYFWAEKMFRFPILAEKSVSISVKTLFFSGTFFRASFLGTVLFLVNENMVPLPLRLNAYLKKCRNKSDFGQK